MINRKMNKMLMAEMHHTFIREDVTVPVFDILRRNVADSLLTVLNYRKKLAVFLIMS